MVIQNEGGLEMITKEVLVGPKADILFRELVLFNVLENYLARTVPDNIRQSKSGVREGEERSEGYGVLVGIYMLEHRRGIQSHATGPLGYREPMGLSVLRDVFVKESKEYTDHEGKKQKQTDGAYVFKDLKQEPLIPAITLSRRKHNIHNYVSKSLREHNKKNGTKVKDFSEIAEKLVPKDFSSYDGSTLDIGCRTEMALGSGGYIVKQTTYDLAGVGKVVKIGKPLDGVEAEFFLYKVPDSELSKYDLKEEDFFNPVDNVIGVLRTYKPGMDKSVRNEYMITPKDLGVSQDMIKRYLTQKNMVPVAVGYR